MTGQELHDLAIFLLVTPLQVFGIFWVGQFFWRRLKSGRPSLNPAPIVDEGGGRYRVPVIATFGGVSGVPWLATTRNNLNPQLVIGPDGIAFRMIRSVRRNYSEIAHVDVETFGATVNLRFTFHGGSSTFAANVGGLVVAKEVLTLLPRDVVLLDGARVLLADAAVAVRLRGV